MPDKDIQLKLDQALNNGNGPKIVRFILASLSGIIPIGGGLIGATAASWSEEEQEKVNELFLTWLKLQEDEIREIGRTIVEVIVRIDKNDKVIEERIRSTEYLKILKKCFRDWSAAESEEKRILIRNLLANAAGTRICSDDVIRLFVTWIDIYSEAHFAVIRNVFKNTGVTREQIWNNIHGTPVREDSAEADLFKLLIHDLSVGHIIRQHREKDYNGNYLKEKPRKRSNYPNPKMGSAFDDEKKYELTELGKQFVHYTMNEIVPRIGEGKKA